MQHCCEAFRVKFYNMVFEEQPTKLIINIITNSECTIWVRGRRRKGQSGCAARKLLLQLGSLAEKTAVRLICNNSHLLFSNKFILDSTPSKTSLRFFESSPSSRFFLRGTSCTLFSSSIKTD